MDRRKFFGTAAVGLSGLAIFPRKSESSQPESLSHEQMVEVILKHPFGVILHGNENTKAILGGDCTREYTYSSGGDYTFKRTKSANGCIVKTHQYNIQPGGAIMSNSESLFDISNPLLKVILLVSATSGRHFAHLEERWVEL